MHQKFACKIANKNKNRSRTVLTNYMKLYIDASYVLGMCPCRLKLEKDSGKYVIVEGSWLFKIFCCLYAVLGTFWVIMHIILAFPKDRSGPSHYFNVLYRFLSCVAKKIIMWKFWVQKQELCNILNFILDRKNYLGTGNHAPKVGRKGTILILLIYVSIGISDFITGRAAIPWNYLPPGWKWSGHWWWTTMVKVGRFQVRLDNSSMHADSNYVPEFSITDRILGVLSAIGWLQRRMFGGFADLFLLIGAITLWSVVQAFISPLRMSRTPAEFMEAWSVTSQTEKKPCWPEVIEGYNNLKKLTDLINQTYGNIAAIFVAVAIFDYSTTIGNLVDGRLENWIMMTGMIFYVTTSYTTLLLCANISHSV